MRCEILLDTAAAAVFPALRSLAGGGAASGASLQIKRHWRQLLAICLPVEEAVSGSFLLVSKYVQGPGI